MPKEQYEISKMWLEQMEQIAIRHRDVFEQSFDRDRIEVIILREKANSDIIKIFPMNFPYNVGAGLVKYRFVIYEASWRNLTDLQKNLVLFNAMCRLPENACDPNSGNFGKVVKPKRGYTHRWTFELAGGNMEWMEINADLENAKCPIDDYQIADPVKEEESVEPKKSVLDKD